MKSKAKRGYIQVIIVVSAIVYFVGFVLIPKAVAQGRVNVVLFYRTRFEVLGQTPKGHHYIHLFDVHVEQLADIFMSHSSLKLEFIDVLVRWQPNLNALVNGRGDEAVISDDDVASVTNYLNLLAQHASPALQSVIEEELAATPLEDTIGMTMNQAWAYLNEDPRFQVQVLVPEEFPHLKAGSTNIIAGAFSETSKYEIGFGEETWTLSSWNNGVAGSWILENQDLSDCVLTTPRSVLDPYVTLGVSYKTLGNTKYEVRIADTKIKELGVLYILYQPLDTAGQPFQGGDPTFILYSGVSNTAQCIGQSEDVLASLYLVPND